MDSTILIKVNSQDLDESGVADLTLDLKNDLANQRGIQADLSTSAAPAGTKGDLALLNQIILQVLGGGGAVASLIGVLRVYVQRVPALEIELEGKGGRKMKLKAKNFSPDTLAATTKQMEKFFT